MVYFLFLIPIRRNIEGMWSNNTGYAKMEGGFKILEVLKILNVHENNFIDPNMFFKIQTCKITRGHDFTIEKGQNRLDLRKHYFSQRTVNELSAYCVHSSSYRLM